MKYIIICIIALLVILNIVFIPVISDEDGLIVDEGKRVRAYSFSELIEDLGDGYSSNDEDPIVVYYIVCPICALFIFFSTLGKNSGACTFGSMVGIIVSMIIYYQFYLGTTRWYIGLSDAYLTFGYYISCVGFISMFLASLHREKG